MKYLFYILLSLSLTALSPVFAGEKKGPIDDMQKGADSISTESSEEENEEDSEETIETSENDELESAYSCSGSAITEMPAIGLYAPLLEPLQKPKMSKAKAKKKKKAKGPSPAREALKP